MRETDGRRYSHATLQEMRRQAIKALQSGEPAQAVARVMGVNVRSVYRWLAAFVEGGQNALLAKEIPGRPPCLNAKQLQWLAKTIRDKTPQQCKFEFALWTRALVQALIAQRPLYRAWQQDPALVEHWLQVEFPKIQALAKRAGALIFFADESGIRSDYHAGTTWAERGKTPIIKATGQRFSWTMLSAISGRGECRFMVNRGPVTASVFREFLRRLLVGSSTPIYLIVDGHPVHKSRLVRQFVEAQEARLQLFFLPPYSPELNPDELVWGHVKARVAKQIPASKDELKARIIGAFRHLQRMPDKVIGFFRHPTCAYALV